MSKRIGDVMAFAIGALFVAGPPGLAQEQPPSAAGPAHGYHLFLAGKPKRAVDRALQGAVRRVSRPPCQRVLEGFADRGGRALSAALAGTGQTAADFLASLYYVEADPTSECRHHEILAFTAPGSRVIHVCGSRFVQWSAKPAVGEVVLIHEFLHALGLGEDPPSSGSITDAVRHRCASASPEVRRTR